MTGILQTEIVSTPKQAIELLRRVPQSKTVSALAYERAIQVLEEVVNGLTTQWKD